MTARHNILEKVFTIIKRLHLRRRHLQARSSIRCLHRSTAFSLLKLSSSHPSLLPRIYGSISSQSDNLTRRYYLSVLQHSHCTGHHNTTKGCLEASTKPVLQFSTATAEQQQLLGNPMDNQAPRVQRLLTCSPQLYALSTAMCATSNSKTSRSMMSTQTRMRTTTRSASAICKPHNARSRTLRMRSTLGGRRSDAVRRKN